MIVADQDTFHVGQRVRRRAQVNGAKPTRREEITSLPVRPALHIGLRFTTSRKRSLIFNLLGVIFGVAFFICTQAQTQGFEQYFISTILGTSGAIVISDRFQNRYTSFNNAERQPRRSAASSGGSITRASPTPPRSCAWRGTFSNVTACAPIVQGNVTGAGRFPERGDHHPRHRSGPATARDGPAHADHPGSLDDYRRKPNGLILGSLLTDKMQLKIGDT